MRTARCRSRRSSPGSRRAMRSRRTSSRSSIAHCPAERLRPPFFLFHRGPCEGGRPVPLAASGPRRSDPGGDHMSNLHDFEARTLRGDECALAKFEGKVCLIVNVASACGLTPQYDGLQRLYSEYRDRGFEVLGFPCNQFGGQEPGTEEEIATFCETGYGVEF